MAEGVVLRDIEEANLPILFMYESDPTDVYMTTFTPKAPAAIPSNRIGREFWMTRPLDSIHEWFATFTAATASEVIVMATLSTLDDRRMR